jgi:hypothetical protein
MANALGVGGRKQRAKTAKRAGLEERAKVRRRLNAVSCCSDAWAEAAMVPRVVQSSRPEIAAHAQGIYPPGGDATSMVVCRCCGRWVPPYYVTTSGHCRDCESENAPAWVAAQWPSSPGCVVGRDAI